MLLEPTDENVRFAKSGKLKVELEIFKSQTTSSETEFNVHPITKSHQIYICYDRLHQQNSTKDSEVCRHLDLISNLPGTNSQVCEQFNLKMGMVNYFIDRLPGVTHAFLYVY